MFRKEPVHDALGYWDTVRFSADNEMIRRIDRYFGSGAVKHLPTGPLSFQRDSDQSAVADEALGINGFYFGARKEYFDSQRHYHRSGRSLRYSADPDQRRFPVPTIMRPDRHKLLAADKHFSVVIASDFRMDGGSLNSCIQEIRAARAHGFRVGLFEIYRYDLGANTRTDMLPEVRREIDGDRVRVLTYGEEATCDLLVLRYPPILQHRQRYVPSIEAREIKVVINQPPVSDYSSQGVVRYDLAACAENLRHYYGKDATWHPNGPMVRDALLTRHADALHHIRLSDEDWHNIIHLPEWQRPAGPRGRGDRLRIGRHSRDSYVKWPSTREDVLAAYPEADDIEVHILGGARTPTELVGHRPANWVVHEFNAVEPRDFLAGIDVVVFFAHPDWVESFPRTVLEAMAVGVPVILPESHRPLFGDLSLYATPRSAVALARELFADPDAYDAQVRKAWAYVAENYSYQMHAERLRAAGAVPDGSSAGG